MQETHSDPDSENVWENEWGGKIIFAHGNSSARGLAILTSKSIFQQMKNIVKDDQGRLIMLDLHVDEYVVTLVGIYAPNEDSPNFFTNIARELKTRQAQKILIGDFNLAINVEIDRENTYSNNNRALQEVENIMEGYKLVDVWRVRNEEKREFSWMKKNCFPVKASRIDFSLVSKGLDQKVKAVEYVSSIMTDHRAIYMCVELQDMDRGSGYWKLNSSLLNDREYVQQINNLLDSMTYEDSDPVLKWESIKRKVKQKSVEIARNKVKEEKIVIANLSEKINEYESQLPLNRQEYDMLEKTKADLEALTLERIKGLMFRSKAKWYEEGERNTKYFYSLEKMRYNAKTCYKMISESDMEITDPNEILREQRKFYAELYNSDEEVNFTLTNDHGIYVPKDIRQAQEVQIECKDLEEAIKTMSNGKTPGEDGIPVEFYKVFWCKIKQIFYEMMVKCYDLKKLHSSARRGILNLIPKANKDARYVKNLRPITLLNTDYKIIEKAIANKMLSCTGTHYS